MHTTSDEARHALAAAHEAANQIKRAVDRQTSKIVLVWATVYFLAPLAMHVWPIGGVVPQQLLLISAITYSIYDGFRCSLISGPNTARIGWLWGITFAFGWVWFLVLEPSTFDDPAANLERILKQMWAFGVSLVMFVYTAMGLWVGRIYVITGITVTVATVSGFLFLEPWFWLWCAVTGGGTLLVAGLLLRSRGRA